MRNLALVLLLFFSVLFVGGCESDTNSDTSETSTTKLTIGELPIVDVLPLYVAQNAGLFEKEGLEIEIVTFNSGAEMNAALDAGQLDGEVDSIMAAILANQAGTEVKIVRILGESSPSAAMFAILSSPNSGIVQPQDLKGKELAISENTIIEYVAIKLLAEHGLTADDVVLTPIPKIPVRLEMLLQNQVDAITISEPLVSLAVSDGASIVIDDRNGDYSLGTLIFRDQVLQESPEAIQGFLSAVEQAIDLINENPDDYKDLLTDLDRVPEAITGQYSVPPFPVAKVPSESQVNDVINWLIGEGILTDPLAYNVLVDSSFLP